jgi:RNA polymerase sigma-70 factor (ECF subfamily)
MERPESRATTALLQAARAGDLGCRERLFERVYAELHGLAERELRGQAGRATMQPTALVNEACLRLVDPSKLDVADRAHFFALAVTVMRRVLVDHYRRRTAARRGGEVAQVTIDSGMLSDGASSSPIDVLALDAALDELAELDARKARVVELRFFSGLTVPEVAAALEVAPRTVEADWHFARAWLRAKLGDGETS